MTNNLDDAYANAPYIEGAEQYPPRWAKAAERFRKSANATLDQSYGPSARQKLDWFRPKGRSKGTLMFVHGGYWKAFEKSDWSHLAAGAVAREWTVVMPGYDLCPSVRIGDITQQICDATQSVLAQTDGSLRITGHSAGGNLAMRTGQMMTSTRLEKIVPISPVGDLTPLLDTSMNTELRLDEAEAMSESPLSHPKPSCDISIWVGAAERPVFIEQAMKHAQVWRCPVHTPAKRHHFDIIEGLEDPASDLLEDVLG